MNAILDELMDSPTECKICTYLSGLAYPQDRTDWTVAMSMNVDVVPNANVVRALGRRGVILTEASVRRHRKNHGNA